MAVSALECGGQGRNRTADASLFRAALYRLSYLAMARRNLEFSKPRNRDSVRKIVTPLLVYSTLVETHMLGEKRLGDIIDDFCVKCRRLTNHAIVSLVGNEAAKVRCRTCYHDHDYRHEQAPPSKKELKKMEEDAKAAQALAAAEQNGDPPAVPEAEESAPSAKIPSKKK